MSGSSSVARWQFDLLRPRNFGYGFDCPKVPKP